MPMKLITQYVLASVHLYGIVTKEKVKEIYTMHHQTPLTTIDVNPKTLANHGIIETKTEFFYDELKPKKLYQYFKTQKANKPYYIPSKDIFLHYQSITYFEENDAYLELKTYLKEQYFDTIGFKIYGLYASLIECFRTLFTPDRLFDIFKDYGIVFNNIEETNQLVDRAFKAYNHTKLWENNGFSPVELRKLFESTTVH